MSDKRKISQICDDDDDDDDDPRGSPCIVHKQASLTLYVGDREILCQNVDQYMHDVAKQCTGDGSFPRFMEHQRFFVGAIEYVSDADEDDGQVRFFLSGYDLATSISERTTRVIVGILDTEQLVPSIQDFLRPYNREKPHEWSVQLWDSTETYLKKRIGYVENLSLASAKRRLITMILTDIGVRHAPNGVWIKK